MTNEKKVKQILQASQSMDDLGERISKALREVEAETIEKCAKVAEMHGKYFEEGTRVWCATTSIATYIRKLKSGGGG